MQTSCESDRTDWLTNQSEILTDWFRHELDRFRYQIQFAEGLCEFHPEPASAWRGLIRQAAKSVAQCLRTHPNLAQLRETIRAAESQLAPLAAIAKEYTVLCVGHAHIDMNWQWNWPETVAVTHDTFGTVLDLMDEFTEFHFSQSQASCLRIIEQHHPSMLARIRQRVQEGRWEVTASHWVEPDKNLVRGESLCRHLLYTRQYLQATLGLEPGAVAIDWSPDAFGHPPTMPTYLAQGGVKHYYCCRPSQPASPLPPIFWWQAPDGARVLTRHDRYWYTGRIEPAILVKKALEFHRATGLRTAMHCYGVGDHGGGPTRQDLRYAREMREWPVFPTIRLGAAREFFRFAEEQEKPATSFQGALGPEFSGCYTSQSAIKRSHRNLERRLPLAETAATLAWAVGDYPYPSETLRNAWLDLLFCQFHDILPGSCGAEARHHALGKMQEALAASAMVETLALRQITSQVDTAAFGGTPREDVPIAALKSSSASGAGYQSAEGGISQTGQTQDDSVRPFVLFNPCPWTRNEIATVTVWERDHAIPRALTKAVRENALSRASFAVRFPDGRRVRAQVVESGGYWFHEFATLAFPSGAVPGLGYTTVAIAEGVGETEDLSSVALALAGAKSRGSGKEEPSVRLTGGYDPDTDIPPAGQPPPIRMENDRVSLAINPRSGGVESLLLKNDGIELASRRRPLATLEMAVERPHVLSSWLPDHDLRTELLQAESVRPLSRGPYVASAEVRVRFRQSSFTLIYELRAGEEGIHIHLRGDWREIGSPEIGVPALRLVFPLALDECQARYEIPFGWASATPNPEPQPALNWFCVSGQRGGQTASVLLINDCKHAHTLLANGFHVDLIRASYEPDKVPEIGEHQADFFLVPFREQPSVGSLSRLAQQGLHPLTPVGTGIHPGRLPAECAGISVEPSSLAVSACKVSEDGRGLVLRVQEINGQTVQAVVRVNREFLGTIQEVHVTDLLERPAAPIATVTGTNTITLTMPPHSQRTILYKLRS